MYIQDKAEINLETKQVVLARDGIYRYLGSELGIAGDNTIYNVKRTTESVLKIADDINKLGVLPITIEHPKSFLDLKNDKSFKKGGVGNCYTNVVDGVNVVCGHIVSMNDDVRELLNKGREVSLGSLAEITKVEDKDYDFEMNVTGVNHLALLENKGRCGNICSITDGLTEKEYLIEELLKMKEESKKEFALSDVEMINSRMSKLEDMVKSISEKQEAMKVADEEVKEEEKEAEEKSDVEAQDSLNEQLKQATADGLDKGKDIAIAHYKTAMKFVDAGLMEAKELLDNLPCEMVDAKLKEMFDLDSVEAEERNGLIAVALKTKTQSKFKDAWNFGKAVEEKSEENKNTSKKQFSIFR